ncbi:MAG: glycosyltransferase [Turicibacter sp.]|nr:glycosyltransferase [Turicibacter sp.]
MISVIIPTYNRAQTIVRSIESVLAQTYQDFEVLVVDDASTDNTEEVVAGIEDERVKYFRLPKNGGAPVARNFGIQQAAYEYIAFQDSDDEWFPQKLELQLAELLEQGADLIGCCFMLHFTQDDVRPIPREEIANEDIPSILVFDNFISTQTILAKKEALLEENFDEGLLRLQDWDLVIRISQRFKVVFLNEVLVDVYRQENSISETTNFYEAVQRLWEKYYCLFSLDSGLKAKWEERLEGFSAEGGEFIYQGYTRNCGNIEDPAEAPEPALEKEILEGLEEAVEAAHETEHQEATEIEEESKIEAVQEPEAEKTIEPALEPDPQTEPELIGPASPEEIATVANDEKVE